MLSMALAVGTCSEGGGVWGWTFCPLRGAQTSLHEEQPLMLGGKGPSTHTLRDCFWGTLRCSQQQEIEMWRNYWRVHQKQWLGSRAQLQIPVISSSWETWEALSILLGTCVPCSAVCAGFIWGRCICSSDKLVVRQCEERVPPKRIAGLLATHQGKKAWCSWRRCLSLNITSSASRQQSRDLSRWWLVLTSPLRAVSHLSVSPMS